MNVEILIPIATTISGGFFIGAIVGYFVKKIVKILIFVIGGIAVVMLYLLQQQIILVNIEKLEAPLTLFLNSVGSSFGSITQITDTNLGIPLAGGLSAGLAIGFVKG